MIIAMASTTPDIIEIEVHPIDLRSSWLVDLGSVRPLGAKPAPGGRERQRSRIRERILATGSTSRDSLAETRRILRERINSKRPGQPT